jgi:hypothetical protein
MKKGIVVAAVLIVLCCVLAVAAILIGYRGSGRREVADSEKELLVTIRDLEGFGIVDPDPGKCEDFSAKKNFDGSLEIEYEYDFEKDPACIPSLWIKSEAEISPNEEQASTSFGDRISVYKLGASLAGQGLAIEEVPSLVSMGDESFGAFLVKDDTRLGNVFVIRKGNTILSLLLAGVYTGEPSIIQDMFEPKLSQVRNGPGN